MPEIRHHELGQITTHADSLARFKCDPKATPVIYPPAVTAIMAEVHPGLSPAQHPDIAEQMYHINALVLPGNMDEARAGILSIEDEEAVPVYKGHYLADKAVVTSHLLDDLVDDYTVLPEETRRELVGVLEEISQVYQNQEVRGTSCEWDQVETIYNAAIAILSRQEHRVNYNGVQLPVKIEPEQLQELINAIPAIPCNHKLSASISLESLY